MKAMNGLPVQTSTRANIFRSQEIIATFLRDNRGRGDPMDEVGEDVKDAANE